MSEEKKTVVLAYSGGLDTSIAIKQLSEDYGYDVIALTIDVGEGKDIQAIKEKALKIGAKHAVILEEKNTLALNYLSWALKANALYEGAYPLNSALSRPLIAQRLVEIAHQYGASAIAHGCTGKGNDQVRFEVALNTLDPHLQIIAPVREKAITRDQAIEYAHKHQIPLPINLKDPYSIDQNIWGRSCECGVLEDPWQAPPENAFGITAPIEKTPNDPEYVEIEFSKGLPTLLNGHPMTFDHIIDTLNEWAGHHGIGRIDHIENRLVGIKSREVYEAPAAITLIKAHQALEALTLTKETSQFKALVDQKVSELIYNGFWFSPLMDSLQAFIETTQSHVNGVVKVKLHKGQATVIGRKSKQSLYQHHMATYDHSDAFDHQSASGFIKLWGYPLEIYTKVHQNEHKK